MLILYDIRIYCDLHALVHDGSLRGCKGNGLDWEWRGGGGR